MITDGPDLLIQSQNIEVPAPPPLVRNRWLQRWHRRGCLIMASTVATMAKSPRFSITSDLIYLDILPAKHIKDPKAKRGYDDIPKEITDVKKQEDWDDEEDGDEVFQL
ncbi:hypothetical protein E3N88_22099 [Mikania micrantha]|uniref:Uncharacterized protein n=1 Tax=Mikania micrantha TaxID=192012 RepID=A0A5N6NC27_9ASTR|nr:hypothetical protein E3N88_22099 [Mikania micrantha]